MNIQFTHTKPNNWWDKLLARQQFEFVVDVSPSEAVQRLSKVVSKGNSGPRRLKVIAIDGGERYHFQLNVMEHMRGFDFTRVRCIGTISKTEGIEQSCIEYETKRTILISLLDSVLIGFLLILCVVVPDTVVRLSLASLLYLFALAFGSDFSRDRKLGLRVYKALKVSVLPAS